MWMAQNAGAAAFRPVARRQADALAAAWAADDREAIRLAEARFYPLAKFIGYEEYVLLDFYYQNSYLINRDILSAFSMIDGNPPSQFDLVERGRNFNAEPDCARFVLACVRHFRDKGAWPESAEALAPAYLSTDFLRGGQAVYAIARFEGALVPHSLERNDNLASKTISRFRQEQGRSPMSLEELRPYAANEEEYLQLQARTRWADSRPFFLRIRAADASDALLIELENHPGWQAWNPGMPLPISKAEKTWAAIDVRFCAMPIFTPTFLECLKNPSRFGELALP
ncbi:MAG: hypothetical protein BWZ10_03114 [candidate division BRC1 bacterium ADurb.BinA364]|nr:MAG: hypothetical protein BWZ10_03114 [candidate division BRC1 bacterium ADurb.BinA364]